MRISFDLHTNKRFDVVLVTFILVRLSVQKFSYNAVGQFCEVQCCWFVAKVPRIQYARTLRSELTRSTMACAQYKFVGNPLLV